MNDPFRYSNLTDNLHLRLFQSSACSFEAGEWRTRNVQSSFWRFYMNFRDGAALEWQNKILPLRAHRLYFVPAGVYFHCRSEAPFEHFYAHFDVIGLPGLALRELFASPIELAPDKSLQARTLQVAHELLGGAKLDLMLCCSLKSLIYGGLGCYLRDLPVGKSERLRQISTAHAPVAPALHFIEENLNDKLTNKQLSALCHLSEDHFIRRFGACVGQTPAQYVQERRITLAAQRLLFSEQSIEQIAHDAGFGNRFYFSRIFSRHTGVSPAAYRKTSRV